MSAQPSLSFSKYEKFVCPFDSNHVIDAFRWGKHIQRCRKQHHSIPIDFCKFNSLHVVRLDLETVDDHHKLCPDSHILEDTINLDKPVISGCLDFPMPSNSSYPQGKGVKDPFENYNADRPAYVMQGLPGLRSNHPALDRNPEVLQGSSHKQQHTGRGRGRSRTLKCDQKKECTPGPAFGRSKQNVSTSGSPAEYFNVHRPGLRGTELNSSSLSDSDDLDPLAARLLIGRGKPKLGCAEY